MDRSKKHALVASLQEALTDVGLVVVTTHSGLTAAEVTNLRRQMRAAGAGFKVTKNRLARLALTGTPFEGLNSLFKGPTGIAFSKDPVAAAKVAVQFANSNEKLKVIGGVLGNQVLDAGGVKALATLPSLDELRAKLVGMLQTPATRVAVVLQAPAGQLARLTGAYAQKGGAA